MGLYNRFDINSVGHKGINMVDTERSHKWGYRLAGGDPSAPARNPICPYGCEEEGVLKGIIMTPDGNAVGVFHDSDGCEFQADIQVTDDPDRKRTLKKDINGNVIHG